MLATSLADGFGYFVAVAMLALIAFLVWAATRQTGPFPPENDL